MLDETLIALADPTRRAILGRLAEGEARVTELARPFAISLNSVSKHIRMLERARLVRRRVAGRDHYLSFDPAPLDAAQGWIEAQNVITSDTLAKSKALAEQFKDQPPQAAGIIRSGSNLRSATDMNPENVLFKLVFDLCTPIFCRFERPF